MPLKDERVAMYNAISGGDYRELRTILRQGCNPDLVLKESTHLRGLTLATVKKQNVIVKTLIRYRASLNLKDKDGKTAVMYACYYNNEDILSLLVTAGADLTLCDNEGRTALHHAAQARSLNCLKSLLNYDTVGVNVVDVLGKSAVMLAACGNDQDPSCLDFLASHKDVDINRVDEDGNSPLIAALHHCRRRHAVILIEKGAELNVKNFKDKTALSKAFEQTRNPEMIAMVNTLLSYGAKPNFSSNDEFQLHEMIARKETNIVQLMIVNGCTPRLRQCKENAFKFDISEKISPLAVALLSNQLGIAKYLLANLFITPFDVTRLLDSHEIRLHLSGNDYFHCSSVLKAMSKSPVPLFVLSFMAVSELIFNKQYKKYRAQSQQYVLSQLPKIIQDKLNFKTAIASLCSREWETLPLMFVPGDTFPLTRPINAVWPIGHQLIKCQSVCCSKSTGYRLLRYEETHEP